jgi:hypothetical protein
MRNAFTLAATLALLYCAAALVPGRVFAPADVVADAGAWKGDLVRRVKVSNSLLSDVATQFMPWDTEARRLVGEGRMPWRNGWAGEGAPLFANPQTALLSPFTWPRLLFGDSGWLLCAMLRVAASALAMTWLARAMGASPAGACASGFVYATCGYAVCWLLYPIANVFAVLPALAAAGLQRRYGLLVLFAALATLGGHPETLFCGVVGIAALLLWERRAGGRVAWAAASGFLLCGVVLVPFFRILGASDARVMRAAAVPQGVRWTAIVSEVLPGFLGSPLRGEIDLTALLPLPENFILRSEAFVGFIVLVMLALAWRRLPPIFRRGLAIGVAAFVLSLRLPLLRLIVRVVPIALEYFTVVFVLFAAAAAGPALGALTAARRSGRALIIAGALLAAAGLLVALPPARPLLARAADAGIARLRARGVLHKPAAVYAERLNGYLDGAAATAARRALLPGLCWLVAGFALAAGTTGGGACRPMGEAGSAAVGGQAPPPVLSRRRRTVVAAAAAGELLAFGLGFNPTVRRSEIPGTPPPVRQLQARDPQHFYYAASNYEVFPANLGTLHGVRDVVSYDVLQPHARVEALARAGYDRVTHSFPVSPDLGQRQALARLGVRWLITPAGIEEIANAAPPPPPNNDPPEGLWLGVLVSAIGAISAAALGGTGSRRGWTPSR